MSDDDIKSAIEALERQEQAIVEEFQRLEARLVQLRTAKAALVALDSAEPMEFDGKLADACRVVLKAAGRRSLHPTEVRDAVKALGYDMSRHDNQMAAVHSVLKRLAQSDEVKTKEVSAAPGQRRYFWVANFADPQPTPPQPTTAELISSVLSRLNEINTAANWRRQAELAKAQNEMANPMLPAPKGKEAK